ncbi:hypothetical protein K0U00_25795, partial [Paenibacillus sepulcri]|nr:hypothetical protein [Paenibacillus sepulcri]
GFPGHSPEEFGSALRMGYYMGPSRLFTENVDVLLQFKEDVFRKTAFGEVWEAFVREFVPANPLSWTHRDADPDIAVIHSDDSNYGQNERLFGSRELAVPASSRSVFDVWHLLSGGSIPAHGNNMHIAGFDFPRHELKRLVSADEFPLWEGKTLDAPANMHPLFYPSGNVLVYDEFVTDAQLGNPGLIVVAGSSVSDETLLAVRRRAESGGATVIAAKWLLPPQWQEARQFSGGGAWLPTTDFLADAVMEQASPLLGARDCWMQRFGSSEVRMYKRDSAGFTLDFEVRQIR